MKVALIDYRSLEIMEKPIVEFRYPTPETTY